MSRMGSHFAKDVAGVSHFPQTWGMSVHVHQNTSNMEREGLGVNSLNSMQGWRSSVHRYSQSPSTFHTKFKTNQHLNIWGTIPGMILIHEAWRLSKPKTISQKHLNMWETVKMYASGHIMKATDAVSMSILLAWTLLARFKTKQMYK